MTRKAERMPPAAVWQQDNTITEVDLARQAKLGAVTDMTIEQTVQGYQVIVGLSWHPERVALRTRRSTTEPRLFKSLERLVTHIRERYPAIRQVKIELLAPGSAKEPRHRNRMAAGRRHDNRAAGGKSRT